MIWVDSDEYHMPGLHASFKLNKDDDAINLYARDKTTRIDGITFRDQETDISYGRYPDAGDNWRFFATPTPGWANNGAYLGRVADTKFSHNRGFYDSPFTLAITCNTNGAAIHYTLNGSEPNEFLGGANTYLYAGPIDINQTTTLRAAAFKPGYLPTNVDTHTYIFLDDVLSQPHMDPAVITAYGAGTLKDAFKSIPTLSITMNEDDYGVMITEGVLKPEFPASVELIYADPNEGEGVRVNCGIARHSHLKTKQAFRLEFKSEFGPARLEYTFFESDPIGADSAVDTFDRIVLRSPGNMPVTYVGDPWTAHSQIDMCGIGAHSTHVHLYLNGRYRGVYNPKERPDAWFTSAYFGGDFDDYFATNHGIERCCGGGCPIILNSPCHLSGDNTRFDQMMNMAYERDLEDPCKYAEFTTLCDAAEYADYTILFWFSGFGDNMDNNWYAGMRNDPLAGAFPPEGFMMFMWDAEYVFLNAGGPPGNEDPWVPDYYFKAGWMISDIWRALVENQDFRMLFADRVYKHCFNGGALIDTRAQARWDGLTDFISQAVICEKARWGGSDTPTTVNMTGHVQIFIDALRNWSHASYPGINLYPDIDPPTFNQHGGQVPSGFGLTMTNPNGAGTIYYTLDGTDPRAPGSGSPVGTPYGGAITLNQSRHVKARVYYSGEWSALNEATFAVGPVAD
ncbi:MAG: chitobiase/beta-hexosaminidase C-terminal domain-containing protein, partial [Planctomycetota bacterium]